MMKNTIDFKWSDVQGEDEEHFVKANLILSLQKQADEDFPKKVNGKLHYYYGIVPK